MRAVTSATRTPSTADAAARDAGRGTRPHPAERGGRLGVERLRRGGDALAEGVALGAPRGIESGAVVLALLLARLRRLDVRPDVGAGLRGGLARDALAEGVGALLVGGVELVERLATVTVGEGGVGLLGTALLRGVALVRALRLRVLG